MLTRLEAIVAQLTGPGVQIIQTPTPMPPSSPSLAPPPVPSNAPPPPRPSLRAAAAKNTPRAVRWIMLMIGVLTALAQGISTLSRPENGPLVQAFMVIAAGLRGEGAPPPSDLPEPVWTPPQ
jgi:hypothetical protein